MIVQYQGCGVVPGIGNAQFDEGKFRQEKNGRFRRRNGHTRMAYIPKLG